MKWRLTTLVFAVLATLSAVNVQAQAVSPGQVLDQYLRMINDGALLTDDGWQKAAVLFELPGIPPTDNLIQVTTERHPGTHVRTDEDRLKIDENFVDLLGVIDSSLRFHPTPTSPEVEGTVFVYYFVLTDKHWEPAPEGGTPRVTTGAREWKIEGSLTVRQAARQAAIRYVTRTRDKTRDPVVRGNADRTIAALKRSPAPRNHI